MAQIKTKKPVGGVKKLAQKLGSLPLIALALITLAVIFEFTLTALGAILIVSDPIDKKADAVVALSGGDDRLVEAARLYQNKQADLIILTETGEVLPDFGKYSEIKRFDAILTLGIPSGAIVVTEKTVNNTEDEAHAVRKLIQPMNLKSLIVVTDPYHTFRTRMIFDDEFRNTNIAIMVHPIPGHWYKSTTWWISIAGWQATFGEYIRIIYYLVRYRK